MCIFPASSNNRVALEYLRDLPSNVGVLDSVQLLEEVHLLLLHEETGDVVGHLDQLFLVVREDAASRARSQDVVSETVLLLLQHLDLFLVLQAGFGFLV